MKCLMNNLRSFVLGIALLAMSAAMFAQTQSPNETPDQQQQPTQPQNPAANPSTDESANSQSTVQIFRGTIGQSEQGYVLKDSGGTIYQLDDQKKAKAFSGRSVRVTGTLDASTSMIHVSSIKSGS